MVETLVWGGAIGGSLLVGSLLGSWVRVPEEIAAGITAVGGGILIAAVGLDVVPEAEEHAGLWFTAGGLVVGALIFVAADWTLTRDENLREFRRSLHAAAAGRLQERSGRGAITGISIALGIFIDGVPETAALGLTIAEGEVAFALLAGILVSNLTESYGASVFIVEGGRSRALAVGLFAGIGAALVLAIVVGATLLSALGDAVIGFSEAVAGGAVLATVSIAILPQTFLETSRFAALATTLGFVLGFLLR